MPSVTYPFPLAERKQVSLHILRRHRGGTGDRGVPTASSPPSTEPARRKQTRSRRKPLPSEKMLPGLTLLLLPCLIEGTPHPSMLATSTKSCGCISDEKRQALSLISPDLSISKEERRAPDLSMIEEERHTPDLSMIECRSRCSPSPFFAFSSSQLKHQIDSEQDSGHIHSLGSCICASTSSSPEPCSDEATVPVFCTSPPGQDPAGSSEGQRPDYSMMALVLLSIAITAIGLTGVRAVWQARRRRLRLAKKSDSQIRSSLAATIAIAQKVIVPGQLVRTPLGKASLPAPAEVGIGKQDQIVLAPAVRPMTVNEGADERKP